MIRTHVLLIALIACSASLQARTALITVSNKQGIVPFAKWLLTHGYDTIIAPGSTYTALYSELDPSERPHLHNDSEGTTLYPTILGNHQAQSTQQAAGPIHMLVCNFFPFEEAIAQDTGVERHTLEHIDIDRVALIRAAAKHYEHVLVVTDPNDYESIMAAPQFDTDQRRAYALKAFEYTAGYDAAIAHYLSNGDFLMRAYHKQMPLRYGLNPHQKDAALYTVGRQQSPYTVRNGFPGYSNMLDSNRAWGLVHEASRAFGMPCAASFKHTSPAGAALDVQLAMAVQKALDADPVSSFGNIIAVSHPVDLDTAEIVKTWVCDGIVAPGYSQVALAMLKKKNNGSFVIIEVDTERFDQGNGVQLRDLDGAVALSQQAHGPVDASWEHKTDMHIPEHAKKDLEFANIVVKYCESSSVAIVKDGCAVGMGTGQQNRLQCIELAVEKAAHWYLRQHPRVATLPFKTGVKRTLRNNAIAEFLKGDTEHVHFTQAPEPLSQEERELFLADAHFALASDACMPFADNIEAAKYVKYIIQPGGGMQDREVIEACKAKGISMVFTGMRLFNH